MVATTYLRPKNLLVPTIMAATTNHNIMATIIDHAPIAATIGYRPYNDNNRL